MSSTATITKKEPVKATFSMTMSSEISEEELITACKKGKSSAQNKLYYQYCDAMLNVAMRYCQNQEEAEDALQDAFLKIFKNIVNFEGRHEGSLTQWIKTIVINSALSSMRKNKKHQITDDIDDYKIADDNDYYVNLEETSEKNEKHKMILNAVQKLPPGYQSVFNLYVMEGYTHGEIAEILEITENTSKSQLSKARKFLKSILGIQ